MQSLHTTEIRKVIEFFYFEFLMQHPHFSKINQPGGLLLLFSHRDVQNTENEKFSLFEN